MLTLYYTPDTCALASHIALEEAGADYETVRISFAADEQRQPAYLKINPKGRVPALLTDRGVITETPAILAYVAQAHPRAQLAPEDPFAFAQVQAFNNYLCATVHVAHSHRMRFYRWADNPAAWTAMQRKVPEAVGEGFALIEETLFAGPWVMGERYTICDPYLFTLMQWLPADGVDVARFPRLQEHQRRMAARPAVRTALAQER